MLASNTYKNQKSRDMFMKIKRYIYVSYDIEDNKLREAIAKKLIFYGLNRVQYSVFRGEISSKNKSDIVKELENVDLGKEDSIHITELCEKCKNNIKIIGDKPKIIQHLIIG